MTPEESSQVHQDIGGLKATVESLNLRLAEYRSSNERRTSDIQLKVDEMYKIMLQAQGGVRTMIMIGSIGAAIGGFVAWFVERLARWTGHS